MHRRAISGKNLTSNQSPHASATKQRCEDAGGTQGGWWEMCRGGQSESRGVLDPFGEDAAGPRLRKAAETVNGGVSHHPCASLSPAAARLARQWHTQRVRGLEGSKVLSSTCASAPSLISPQPMSRQFLSNLRERATFSPTVVHTGCTSSMTAWPPFTECTLPPVEVEPTFTMSASPRVSLATLTFLPPSALRPRRRARSVKLTVMEVYTTGNLPRWPST
mmetsp:Transcript_18559/g.70422  ORF Transcript_18559/g.70422 Transcript_18559/m.70422 type:complete len:220 (+) Transcript_18559:605-1264(+)